MAQTKSQSREPGKADAAGGQRYKVPALEKGLDILELLSLTDGGLSQTEVAAKLDRSVNEIFRMLICLERRGYISRENTSEKFHLTLKLFELGLRNPPTNRLVEASAPALQKLARKIMQPCHVAIPSGGNVMVVAQRNSPQPMGFSVSLGAQVAISKAVSGAVLLAYQTPEVREHWLSQAGATRVDQAYLRKAYKLVLTNGYLQQDSKTIEGLTELACPVFDHSGQAVASISAPILRSVSDPVDIESCIPEVKETGFEISRQLGWLGEL